MTEKDKDLTLDSQFEDYLKRLEKRAKEDDKKEKEAEKDKKDKKEDKEHSSSETNDKEKDKKKLSDEEKDSISKKVDKEEKKEESESTEEKSESEVVEEEQLKKPDSKHIRHSALEEYSELEDAIERERSKRMRQTSEEEKKEEEQGEPELSEEEQEIAEMQAKKEKERLEREERQAQFKEAHEKYQKYQERNKLYYDAAQRDREARELAEAEELEARKSEEIYTFIEKGKEKDTFADDFTKSVNAKGKDAKKKTRQDPHMQVDGVYEDDLENLPESHNLKKLDKNKKKQVFDNIVRKVEKKQVKLPKFTPSLGTAHPKITESEELQKAGEIFSDLQEESIKDTFADSFTKAVNSKDDTVKSKAKQGDHMKVNGVYDEDNDTLTKGRKIGSDKNATKDIKVKTDSNKKVENLLKDKDTVKSVATDVAKDTVGEVQSAAKPSMGQENSKSDEEKKKSNAKKVGMKYFKLAEKELGKQVTVGGLSAELIKPNTAAGQAFKASTTGKALDAIKNIPLSQLVGNAMEVDDKKTSEENLRNNLQKGFSIATKGDNFHKVLSSADKMLSEINQPKLGDKRLLKGEGVDKSYKLKKGELYTKNAIRLKGGESEAVDGSNLLAKASKFKVRGGIGYNSQAQVGLSSASANEVSGIGQGSRKLLLNKKDALARTNVFRGDVGSFRIGSNAVGKNGLPLDNRVLIRELINADKVSGANGRIRLNSQVLREGNGLSQVSGGNILGRTGEKTTLAGRSVVVGKIKVNGALVSGGTSVSGSGTSALGASAMGSAGTISAATIERTIQGLKQNASMAGEFLGKMMKSTSHNENDEEMNPSNMAQKGRKMLNELNKKQTTYSTDSLKAKGITSSDYTTKEALLDEQQKAASKVSEVFGKKHTEHQIVNKGDGSLRMVREGHDAGVKEIKPDAPGLARKEADKKLLEGRKLDPKMKGTDSLDKAKEVLRGNKDGTIRLGRGGKFDVVDKEAQNLGKAIDKMGSKQVSSLDKLNIVGKNGGKMGNFKVGRGAQMGAKSGPLSQQAESIKQSWQMMRQYWARNSFANQLIGGGQGNVLGKALAKKAVVSVVSTGVSAGAASGGSSLFGGGSKVRQDSFAVIAADTYDDANDKTPMTQDAVNMMKARIAAYIKQALGKKLTADDQLKAGGKYVPVPDIGIKHYYNGKPVTQFDYKLKFVDRNMKKISKKYFALDEFSDLAFPGDSVAGGGSGGAGGDGRALSPTDTGHPLNVPYVITQGLHPFAAIDLAAPEGSPIFAVSDGEVLDVNTTTMHINGNYLIHTLPNGEMIYYGHMQSPPLVNIGDKVTKGQHIGYVGQTGLATGPHIHFDIRSGGLWQAGSDPWKLLPGVPSGAVGITVDPATSKGDTPDTTSSSSSGSGSNSSSLSGSSGSGDSSGAQKNANGETQMDVMFNIVGALETGGQVYGQRDYSNFINAEAGAEVTATLGWSSFYGVHGKEYLQRFKAENPDLFSKLDTAGVNSVLDISWEASHWQANPAQKAAIVEMISTPEGRKLQDTMTAERLSVHWKYAVENYTDNMRAVAWYTNIAELAGPGVAQSVFADAHGDYSLENLYNVTMSYNGGAASIGASMYHRRHALYKQWIEEHFGADEKVDLANIKVTGAGSINKSKTNSRNSAGDRNGQILLIKVILSMSAIGSHYGEPISEEDYFKYCIEVLDNAFKGKKGDGIKITYRDNGLTASAFTEFRILTELHELEEMDTKFKAWDLFDETYGDMNPQAYIALPNKDFEEIFNIKININGSGLNGGGGGGGGGGANASGIPYVKWALEIAADDSHGYAQDARNGDPDYDCSSFIFYALKQAGFDVGETPFTTFNMRAILERNGFTAIPYDPSTLEVGDILLDENEHTEIYIGNGQTVGAHVNERGDIRNGEPGDQSKQEISVMNIWRSWPLVMRPPKSYMDQQASALGDKGDLQFDENGLLKMKQSDRAQEVINLLMAIPGHSNGASYHQLWNIDSKIDELTTEEAVWIMTRIENPGFGQTGAGLPGVATPETHKAFVEQQVNRRFGGSIHELLKHWGTYSYTGY